MPAIEAFAPAKVNLALHVTGVRADGYHLLDSLVMFADVGDAVTVDDAPDMALRVTGPRADGVPTDARNLCWQAALAFGTPVSITLEKHLPNAAGIGGGSSDAAAVLCAMERLYDRPAPVDPLTLGADVPVCRVGRAAHMAGIGERVMPLTMPELPAVLVNPGVAVPTGTVFKGLTQKDNPPMEEVFGSGGGQPETLRWLTRQRNDLQAPAIAAAPIIADVLRAVGATRGCALARMSGSGATCFGLYPTRAEADAAAAALRADHPDWWIEPTTLR